MRYCETPLWCHVITRWGARPSRHTMAKRWSARHLAAMNIPYPTSNSDISCDNVHGWYRVEEISYTPLPCTGVWSFVRFFSVITAQTDHLIGRGVGLTAILFASLWFKNVMCAPISWLRTRQFCCRSHPLRSWFTACYSQRQQDNQYGAPQHIAW